MTGDGIRVIDNPFNHQPVCDSSPEGEYTKVSNLPDFLRVSGKIRKSCFTKPGCPVIINRETQ